MDLSTVTDAVSSALVLPEKGERGLDASASVDLGELRGELDTVADDAFAARQEGLGFAQAVADPRFDALRQFHQDLRDSLFVEIPAELQPWVEGLSDSANAPSTAALGEALTALAQSDAVRPSPLALGSSGSSPPSQTAIAPGTDVPRDRQRALAELLVFESVRLRLLVAAWQSETFERLGGEESDVDEIAWEEVEALLAEPALALPGVRPLQVMFAAASVSLAKDAATRADELRQVDGDVREELGMRAKLRAALRELRLTESVLLENALSNLLGHERRELRDLQEERPVALEGLSRQAMDQRVSRGRRALTRPSASWPRRRRPALFDLLRTE